MGFLDHVRATPFSVVLLATLVAAGCSTLDLDPRQASQPVWVTEGESALRQNAVVTRIEPPLELRWDFNAGAGFGPASPLIVGDVVLVANRKGEVHAIDINAGKRLGQITFGESIEGTPVLEKGVLYVPVGWGGKALYAYDVIRGTTKWKVSGAPVTAGLVLDEDRVVAADTEGRVRAYGLSDGSVLWDVALGDEVAVKGAPAMVGDFLIVADDGGGVTALRARDGSLGWTTNVGAPVHVTPAADSETIFVSTTRGRLVALSAEDGSVRWEYRGDTGDAYLASPAVGEWEVVFGGSDGLVRALQPTDGAQVWESRVDAAVTAPPLITDNTVYVGTMRGELLALDREDGEIVWETELDGRIKSAFAAKGTQLVVLAEPRLVYLFDLSNDSYAMGEE